MHIINIFSSHLPKASGFSTGIIWDPSNTALVTWWESALISPAVEGSVLIKQMLNKNKHGSTCQHLQCGFITMDHMHRHSHRFKRVECNRWTISTSKIHKLKQWWCQFFIKVNPYTCITYMFFFLGTFQLDSTIISIIQCILLYGSTVLVY